LNVLLFHCNFSFYNVGLNSLSLSKNSTSRHFPQFKAHHFPLFLLDNSHKMNCLPILTKSNFLLFVKIRNFNW
jgi:hypothetical protein